MDTLYYGLVQVNLKTVHKNRKNDKPSSSEVGSSAHAFLGNFVLRLWTLLLKLSIARWANDWLVGVRSSWPRLGAAVEEPKFENEALGFKPPLLCTLDPMLDVSGEASLGTGRPDPGLSAALEVEIGSRWRGRVFRKADDLESSLVSTVAAFLNKVPCSGVWDMWNSFRPL
jgi:hypothetical protein